MMLPVAIEYSLLFLEALADDAHLMNLKSWSYDCYKFKKSLKKDVTF